MTATAPRIRIEFRPDGHKYLVNGEPFPSATQILEAEGLTGCPFWTEQARKRGTAVHRIALLIGKRPIRGNTVEEIVANSGWDPASTPNTDLHGFGYGVARFYLESGLRPILVEEPVASLKFRICGTLDLYAELPATGERWLVDMKTGRPEEAAHVQTSIYDICLQETHGLKTDKRVVVWVKPQATYQIMLPKLAPSVYENAAMCAVNLYRWREQFKKLG